MNYEGYTYHHSPTVGVQVHRKSRFSRWEWRVTFAGITKEKGKAWKYQTAVDRIDKIIIILAAVPQGIPGKEIPGRVS